MMSGTCEVGMSLAVAGRKRQTVHCRLLVVWQIVPENGF